MKRLGFACFTLAALAGCGRAPEPQPEPQLDPALVERLAAANVAEPEAPKLDKADRIVDAVDRAPPDRVAGAAERLLDR